MLIHTGVGSDRNIVAPLQAGGSLLLGPAGDIPATEARIHQVTPTRLCLGFNLDGKVFLQVTAQSEHGSSTAEVVSCTLVVDREPWLDLCYRAATQARTLELRDGGDEVSMLDFPDANAAPRLGECRLRSNPERQIPSGDALEYDRWFDPECGLHLGLDHPSYGHSTLDATLNEGPVYLALDGATPMDPPFLRMEQEHPGILALKFLGIHFEVRKDSVLIVPRNIHENGQAWFTLRVSDDPLDPNCGLYNSDSHYAGYLEPNDDGITFVDAFDEVEQPLYGAQTTG